MKSTFIAVTILLSLALWGCGSHDHSGHNHDGHNHAGHSHVGHSHEGHNHAGHSHAAHDHSGHNHSGHSHEDTKDAGEIVFSKHQAEAAGLKIEVVSAGDFTDVISTGGHIISAQGDQLVVVASSAGVVTFAPGVKNEGASIKAGQTIATVSARQLSDGDPARRAKIEFENASREYQRAKSLVADKIISQRQYEAALQRYDDARNAYEAISANISENGVKVTSSINGYITSLAVDNGDFVNVGDPIATVSQNRRLQLRADVPERHFGRLASIRSANFRLSYSDQIYSLDSLRGTLISRGRSSVDNGFFIPVIFEFDNRGNIISGSYAEIYLLGKTEKQVISIPVSALTEEQGVNFVYIQLDDECYRKQEVKVGRNTGHRVEILSGLTPNQKVVTQGAYQVKLAAMSAIIPEGHSHHH